MTDKLEGIFLAGGWILAGFFLLMFIMCVESWGELRADAVRNGWAHYEVDVNGNTKLVWNKAPDAAEPEQSDQTKTQR